MREKFNHLYLDSHERKLLIHSLVELKNQLIQQDRYTDCIDELIFKVTNTCSEMMASGDSFRQYLDVQGCFDRYSVANAILVSAQMPEATQLKEYSKWKANRVYVNKDAQKIIMRHISRTVWLRSFVS